MIICPCPQPRSLATTASLSGLNNCVTDPGTTTPSSIDQRDVVTNVCPVYDVEPGSLIGIIVEKRKIWLPQNFGLVPTCTIDPNDCCSGSGSGSGSGMVVDLETL